MSTNNDDPEAAVEQIKQLLRPFMTTCAEAIALRVAFDVLQTNCLLNTHTEATMRGAWIAAYDIIRANEPYPTHKGTA
jgi:hypothetical protein